MTTLYFFHLDTGQFLEEKTIDCPENYELIIPFDATLIPPPLCAVNEAPQFNRITHKWAVVVNFTDVPYYVKKTRQRIRIPFGEYPSSSVTNVPPPKLMQQALYWDESNNRWVHDIAKAREIKITLNQTQADELYDQCLDELGIKVTNLTNHHFLLMSTGKVPETEQFTKSMFCLTQIVNEINGVTLQINQTNDIREIADLTFDLTYRQLINNKQ